MRRHKLIGVIIVVVIIAMASGCKGSGSTDLDPELYKGVIGGDNGGQVYDSDKVYDPANRSMNGPFIW